MTTAAAAPSASWRRNQFVLTAVAGCLVFRGPVMLGVALGLCAVGLGAGMTVSYTVAGLVVPAGAHGSAFGVLSAAWLAGLAVSPIVSGLLAALHLRLVFLLNLGVLALTWCW